MIQVHYRHLNRSMSATIIMALYFLFCRSPSGNSGGFAFTEGGRDRGDSGSFAFSNSGGPEGFYFGSGFGERAPNKGFVMTSGFGESPHIYEFGNMPKGERKFFKDGNSEGTMFRCVGLEYDLLGGGMK